MESDNLEDIVEHLMQRSRREASAFIGMDARTINKAINSLYDQLPSDMKRETREILNNPEVTSETIELLSELPQLILKSSLPQARKHAMLRAISELYQLYVQQGR